MNLTYSKKLLFISTFLFLGISLQVSAQEDRAGEYDASVKQQQQPVRELTREGDSYSYPESGTDGRISGAPVNTKETTQPKDATATTNSDKVETETVPANKLSEKKLQKEDDSVLSFNFLYYIIQRFKLSDIIE